jgi:uncharacterized protein YoxC
MFGFEAGTIIFQILVLVLPLIFLFLIIFLIKSISRNTRTMKKLEKPNQELLAGMAKQESKD